MIRKLLTDARETSYVILSSLLTAECSGSHTRSVKETLAQRQGFEPLIKVLAALAV